MPRTSWSPRTISQSAWRREDWLWLLLITAHGAGWPCRVHPYDTLGVEIVPPRLSFCSKLLHHLPRSPMVQHSLPDFEIDFWTWKATDESVFQMPISQQGHVLDIGGEKVHRWIYFSCRVGLTQSSTQYMRGWRWSFFLIKIYLFYFGGLLLYNILLVYECLQLLNDEIIIQTNLKIGQSCDEMGLTGTFWRCYLSR